MKKLLLILTAAATLFCACSKENTPAPKTDGSRLVRFTANVGEYSFKSIDALDAADEVGIFAGAPISKNNVPLVVGDANALSYKNNTNTLEWSASQIAQGTANSFYAYAPYDENRTTTDFPFYVYEDQNTEANYKASDLMLASAADVAPETNVSLTFAHALTKVVINVTSATLPIASVKICGLDSKANVDVVAGTVAVDDNLRDIDMFFVGKSGNVYTYAAIVVPQANVSPYILVKAGQPYNLEYKYSISAAYTFVAGKKSTADVTVTYNPGQVSANAVGFASFTQPSAWTEADDAAAFGGDGIQGVNNWNLIGDILGSSWSVDFPMIEDSANSQFIISNITIAPGAKFKFRIGDSWTTNLGANEAVPVTVGDGKNIALVSDGGDISLADAEQAYDIYLKPGENQVWIQPHSNN
ncbi:MAG: fimbrillin family protein [Bacteroidales bacterium]|nr:fimbrillin family protein [Bacteroidales bacterium]